MKNKIAIIIAITALLILILYSLFFLQTTLFAKDKIYLALVGPAKTESGQSIIRAVRMYLENINHEVNGKKIELFYYDDIEDEKSAEETALKISNKTKSLLVLGHYYNLTSLAAGIVYKRNGVPAITASSTAEEVTSNNEWYFRTIPNNRIQAIFIANYISRILKKNSVNIIFEDDDYSLSLFSNFEKAAMRQGIAIKNKWKINTSQDEDNISLEPILKSLSGGEVFFLATHASLGAKLAISLKNTGKQFTIFGDDEFSSKIFLDKLKEYSEEGKGIDYYSDGIYCVTPYMSAIASDKGHQFEKQFISTYGKKPSWEAACYYDAVMVAIEAIKRADIKGTRYLIENRRKIKDALDGFFSPENAIRGVTEDIYFNRQRDITRPYSIAKYSGKNLVASFVQYRTVSQETEDSEGLFEKIFKGEKIIIDSKLMKSTHIVNTWIDEIDFNNIDFNKSFCALTFNVSFRYANNFNFDSAAIEFKNSLEPIILGKPVSLSKNDIETTIVYKVNGIFKLMVDYSSYPFDSQTIAIRLQNKRDTIDKVIYLPDELKNKVTLSQNSIKGWDIKSQMIFENFSTKESSLGLPRFFDSKYRINHSLFNIEIQMKRKLYVIILNLFLPIAALLTGLYFALSYPLIFLMVFLGTLSYHLYLLFILPCNYIMGIEYLIFGIYLLICIFLLRWKFTNHGGYS
ncbi:MAG: ABC transporter substrate-binding protein [Desulfobacterales bacterium]|nr:ABC transporter substrate-binding protein [Desulfobacterales bacterium]MBF0395450.1 ABC transporter substrate-binding protein [Desulfobacterales bacterium]